ncbi:phosphoadenylyl-sulfate reductase [Calidifontibacter sp. DB0510]|uniref:Adenosine 5'-phosphosulfate reductase n=1 Tax=Metallococcus carri TaxID=1656884 RepID=A0A967E8K3_9MICO|nr:phosphoadenylyl-sulfate reductase [Metallococcus carri]NHN54285.1 phosphoadenylyl-sulfate reductase [Metallococcus carri]NOP36875.1 phosphoadenylyl-sulfate reductase [Calidifontibacter sp. DB2511S]
MTTATIDRLRDIARTEGPRLEKLDALEVLRWAADEFGRGLAVAASMQDTVLAHLASRALPGVDVLFLETGYHFTETLQTRDEVARRYAVTVRDLRSRLTVAEQDEAYGKDLFASDPDLCCALRKTQPLDEALDGYDIWATGVRRSESPTRANTPVLAFDERREILKLAPLATWTDEQVEAYASEHDVVTNPLLAQGYPSIGCWPCTRRVAPGEDRRAGRWSGTDKTECGIQL